MDRVGRLSRLTLVTSAAVLAVVLGTLGPGEGVGFGTPLVSTGPGPAADAGLDLPDIVVILTDDQRVETLAGMPRVQSLLVDRGTTFSRAMVPTSLCCPSRGSMLTGS
jgi:arylsulfatase A-like enzyme